MNVLMGERYKVATKETKDILSGKYGETVKPFNEEVKKKVLGDDAEVITCRPADLIRMRWTPFEKNANSTHSRTKTYCPTHCSRRWPQTTSSIGRHSRQKSTKPSPIQKTETIRCKKRFYCWGRGFLEIPRPHLLLEYSAARIYNGEDFRGGKG